TDMGIPKEKISVIFNRFEQADTSYSRQYTGAGLGLSICQQLVSLMGGTIWVESLVNVGSSFHFIIPLSITDTAPVALGTAREPAASRLKGVRILLVDDNEVNRNVASMMLAQEHQVTTAENGLDALTALGEASFDIVLMDVQMPRMDGITATRMIRALEKGRPVPEKLPVPLEAQLRGRLSGIHIPIVAMTAHAMAEDKEKCLVAGMDDYISKPFHYPHLVAVLERLLRHLWRIPDGPPSSGPETVLPEPAAATPPEDSVTRRIERHFRETTHLSDAQIAALVTAARSSLDKNLRLADEALGQGNLENLAFAGHALKGILLQCGMAEKAKDCQAMYDHAQQKTPYPFAETLKSLREAVAGFLCEKGDVDGNG
ncbi:response regulator, partial [Desulfosarcina sp. OttesenSCG-928-G10]|nr:response regulator [Desulfosarcina sp. OttesenSCG-928-G10]